MYQISNAHYHLCRTELRFTYCLYIVPWRQNDKAEICTTESWSWLPVLVHILITDVSGELLTDLRGFQEVVSSSLSEQHTEKAAGFASSVLPTLYRPFSSGHKNLSCTFPALLKEFTVQRHTMKFFWVLSLKSHIFIHLVLIFVTYSHMVLIRNFIVYHPIFQVE